MIFIAKPITVNIGDVTMARTKATQKKVSLSELNNHSTNNKNRLSEKNFLYILSANRPTLITWVGWAYVIIKFAIKLTHTTLPITYPFSGITLSMVGKFDRSPNQLNLVPKAGHLKSLGKISNK